MRRLVTSMTILLAAMGSAEAVSRYNIDRMSCASVNAALAQDSPAVLSQSSPQGVPVYNLYVGSRTDCRGGQVPRNRTVQAADGACPVIQCATPTHNNSR